MSEFDLQTFKIFFDLLRLDDDEGAPGCFLQGLLHAVS